MTKNMLELSQMGLLKKQFDSAACQVIDWL